MKNEINKKTIKTIFIFALILILVNWGLSNYLVVGNFIQNIFRILFPIMLGFIIAFALNIPMIFFEKNLFKNLEKPILLKLKRGISLILSILVILLVLVFIIILVIPQIIQAFVLLGESLTKALPEIEKWININISSGTFEIEDYIKNLNFDWKEMTENGFSYIMSNIVQLFGSAFSIFIGLMGGITNAILGIIFAIYILISKDTLKRQTKSLLTALLSSKMFFVIKYVINLSITTFSKFVVGQVTDALILGLMCFLGMFIFGFPYALTISALIGVMALIPIVGAFIGGAIGAFLILMVDPGLAGWFIVYLIILQQIEGNLIYPKVVGNSVGLPGLWVLIAVTIGASLWGIVGMLIMVPTVSLIYILMGLFIKALNEKKSNKEKKKFIDALYKVIAEK